MPNALIGICSCSLSKGNSLKCIFHWEVHGLDHISTETLTSRIVKIRAAPQFGTFQEKNML